jgi:hypothetical protein
MHERKPARKEKTKLITTARHICRLKTTPSKNMHLAQGNQCIGAPPRQPRYDSHSSAHKIWIIPPNVIEWNKKQYEIAGKGYNEPLEIVHPLEHTTAATEAADVLGPGNGGTWHSHFWLTETVVAKTLNKDLICTNLNSGGKTLEFYVGFHHDHFIPSCGADWSSIYFSVQTISKTACSKMLHEFLLKSCF